MAEKKVRERLLENFFLIIEYIKMIYYTFLKFIIKNKSVFSLQMSTYEISAVKS